MVFTTRCCKNKWLNRAMRTLWAWGLLLAVGLAQAQSNTEVTQFQVERVDDEVLVSAQMLFDLPPAVEDALLKGIPLFFVAEADIVRERWYWYDKQVSTAVRNMRLAYQPLTRRWRLNVTSGAAREGSLGLALNQNFDTLPQALSSIKRVLRWKVANAAELDGSVKYKLEFRFRLDLSQLPRPFQIGAIGQSDWDLAASTSMLLALK